LLGYGEFIVKAVIDNPMHGPAQQAALTFNLRSGFAPPSANLAKIAIADGPRIRDQDLFRFVS